MEKINIPYPIGTEDLAILDQLAARLGRDRSYLIKQAVLSFIEHHRWHMDEIERAVKEAKAGDFAFEKEVLATFAELRK